MAGSLNNIYWDACVFLSYINDEDPSRTIVLEALLGQSSSKDSSINLYTSVLSHVEVSFADSERRQRMLDPEQEHRISALWSDTDAVLSVEFNESISKLATNLLRESVALSLSLKPADAIHLATAQWLSQTGLHITEFHTYDLRLQRYEEAVGFRIVEPNTEQPRLL